MVSEDDLTIFTEKIGKFGRDNRACLDGKLHRISALKDREGRIIGLTLRAGRHVAGSTQAITDILFGKPSASKLVVGGPGTGKTSKLLRCAG